MTATIGRYRLAFAAACATPASIGLGSAIFFLMPEAAPVLVQLLVGGVFLAVAYFAFMRYDFEVDQLIAAGEFANRPARLAVLRPSTAIRVAAFGQIGPRAARAMVGLALTVLAAGVGVGIVLISISWVTN